MPSKYENFPLWMILLANLLSLSVYAISLFVFARLGIVWMLLYLAYCIYFEIRLLRGSCVNCYYYGKSCSFGKGRLCALFFRRGDPGKFTGRKITWRDLVPDVLVTLFPLLGGIILLIRQFDWLIVLALAVILILTTTGNSFVRGSLACKNCKQKDLGCPAAQMFDRAHKKKEKED
ncbi:MAG: hypothetical protein PHW79_03605 [Candidatus Marinimicrobia bacterium]|nr:hypothetical protein [Candidatus Neomarinimicrobiota bacterium]